ncbi:MAG: NAD(+) salvage pathway protein [Stictis urceolatum]|nr:NAD(+) salvage pathway protein [Stictis urceolata]
MKNPSNPTESRETTLWPPHCIRDTPGAEFVPGLDTEKLDGVVHKGTLEDLETYSCIADIFGNREAGFDVDVVGRLREREVSHVFVVGLAGDFCVRYSALDLAREGFVTFVVGDCVGYVDEGKGREETLREWEGMGVKVVQSDEEEVEWVRRLEQ